MDSEETVGKFVVEYPEYAEDRENLTIRERADGSFAVYLNASRRSYPSSSSIVQVGWVQRDGSYCFRQKHLQTSASVETIVKLARALNVDVGELFKFDEK